MNMQKPLKCAAAAISAILVYANGAGVVMAETTLGGSEANAIVSTTVAETTEQMDLTTENVKTEWWKAEITDYDSSLSLISYELTPETTENEETDEVDVESIDTAAETTTEKVDKVDKTEKTDKAVPSSPTPVESKTTGSAVGDIPQAQDAPEVNAQSGEFAFTTYGWGHGVGLSQNGANFYAMYSGWSYQDILFHYYQGTYLMNTGTAETEEVTVNGETGDVLSMVAGIVYREIGGTMSNEAIKAQAVAVYSYIKYYGDNARDLKCKANPPQNVIDACASVLGEALYYDGNFALTMFSASSGGSTANCYDVFSNDVPYLRSVPSDYDASCDPHYGTVKYIASSEVKRLVEARYGITLSEDPANWFQIAAGDSGYIYSVVIDGQITIRGNDLKICLGLKSPKFDISFAQ